MLNLPFLRRNNILRPNGEHSTFHHIHQPDCSPSIQVLKRVMQSKENPVDSLDTMFGITV